jgi:tellurite resistance protein TehA-like permease
MPNTRQPFSLANWAATLPTVLLAAHTTTVARGSAI